MRIKVERISIGTSVSIFMANSEAMSTGIDTASLENGKDWRVKRTFSTNLSQKGCEATELILKEILKKLNEYMVLLDSIGENAVIERINVNLLNSLDSYQISKVKQIVTEIAIPIVFNKVTSKDAPSIKAKYNLSSSDLLISFIGGFGFGKTTTIKKILNFDDGFRFLLVDNGRTTIYNTFIRGLIVDKDNSVRYTNDSEKQFKEDVSKYKFKNIITLHSKEHIYTNIIANLLNVTFEKFHNSNYKMDNIEIIRTFIKYDKCPLDGLFGAVNEDTIKSGFYKQILDIFKKNEGNESELSFKNDEDLKKQFYELYENLLSGISNEMTYDKDTGHITFELTEEQISNNIDEYYGIFTDNKIKGGGFRICVQEIYLETNLCIDNYLGYKDNYPKKIFNEDGTLEYHSIVFADTVGCGHEKTNKIPMTSEEKSDSIISTDMDIHANRGILTESDVIVLIDKATESMQASVISQLYTLETLGLKNKLLLAYTHYNQFVKSDMQTDSDRVGQLETYLESSINSMYPPKDPEIISKKAQIYYNHFNDNNKQGIIYLKGLVERANKANTNPLVSLKKSRGFNNLSSNNPEDELAKTLNEGFENSEFCLVELIEKAILINEKSILMSNQFFSIQSFHKEKPFILSYGGYIYNSFPKLYLNYEYNIYHYNTPAYNTTRALCSNAVYGTPVHYGNSITLRPLEDFIGLLQDKVSQFLGLPDNNFLVIEKDEADNQVDKDISLDFLIDEIKKCLNSRFTEFCTKMFVDAKIEYWNRLANDSGSGVKYRRSRGIYDLLENIANMPSFNSKLLDILTETIDDIIEQYNI